MFCLTSNLKFFSLENTRNLGINALSGSVPKELGNLTTLVSL
jgi:hypothetical protein